MLSSIYVLYLKTAEPSEISRKLIADARIDNSPAMAVPLTTCPMTEEEYLK